MRTRLLSLVHWSAGARGARASTRLVALAALAVTLTASPTTAGAQTAAPAARSQFVHRFTLRAELGVGTMFPEYQRNTDAQQFGGNTLGYDNLNVHTHLRLAFSVIGPFAVQASFTNDFFPTSTNEGTGRVMAFEGGLRFEPRIGQVGRLFADGNVGYALTGPFERAMFNVGVGFEFNIIPALALGPVFRVTDVFQPGPNPPRSNAYPYDAVYWSVGLSISARVPPEVQVPDTDCDTVVDPEDRCPTVAQGPFPDPNRHGCPMPDSDGDYVVDPEDRCPTVREGEYPDPARMGCPNPDNDDDGVLNEADRCPQTPQGSTPDPQRPGCPDPLAHLEGSRIVISEQIFFDSDQSAVAVRNPTVAAANYRVLNAVLRVLHANPTLRVEVQGHTDNQCSVCAEGPLRHNHELSRRRAVAIREYLIHPLAGGTPVAPDRLTVRPFGQTVPLGPNDTEAGRQLNRRVVFQVLNENFVPPTIRPDATPHPRPRPTPAPAPARPCVVTTQRMP